MINIFLRTLKYHVSCLWTKSVLYHSKILSVKHSSQRVINRLWLFDPRIDITRNPKQGQDWCPPDFFLKKREQDIKGRFFSQKETTTLKKEVKMLRFQLKYFWFWLKYLGILEAACITTKIVMTVLHRILWHAQKHPSRFSWNHHLAVLADRFILETLHLDPWWTLISHLLLSLSVYIHPDRISSKMNKNTWLLM